MDNFNDPYSIITSAEQLVAELWEAKKADEGQVVEEPVQDAPWCIEAVEDEARRVEAFAQAFAMESFEGFKAFTLAKIDRYSNDGLTAGMAIYEIDGLIEFNCGKCEEIHNSPMQFNAIRMSQGGPLVPLEIEVILDRRKEIIEKRQGQGGPQIVHIALDDFVDGIAGRLQAKMAEKSAGPDDDEDGLPPAAIVGPDEDEDPLPPAAIVEDTESRFPVVNVAEYRVMPWNEDEDEEQPGLLRRVWDRLRRR